MARTISIGTQSFERLRTGGYFYVDKTGFVRDWWRAADDVTLVCRPRRFSKTLNLDTVRCFLSRDYLRDSDALADDDRAFLDSVSDDMSMEVAADAVNQLCSMLRRHRSTRARPDRGEGLRRRPRGARHRPRAHPHLRHRLPRQGSPGRVSL